ncbi:hypothetical protein Fot_37609 [Forsythia ovata]|uniref:Uncharacterized protein n=1 Tax=Forsythia ovata TaxID=205694 RepID=A0ABD1S1W6_9LAMI
MEDAEDPWRARRGREDPSSVVKDHVSQDREASQTSIAHLLGDELDPTALGKLLALAAIAATSVYKYWTFAFGKAIESSELTELLNELHLMVREDKDVDARLENKDLREQLAFSEDARARAIYDISKAKMIQGPMFRLRRLLNRS